MFNVFSLHKMQICASMSLLQLLKNAFIIIILKFLVVACTIIVHFKLTLSKMPQTWKGSFGKNCIALLIMSQDEYRYSVALCALCLIGEAAPKRTVL